MKPEASRALITQITIRVVDASVIQRSDNVDRGISVIPLAVRFATSGSGPARRTRRRQSFSRARDLSTRLIALASVIPDK